MGSSLGPHPAGELDESNHEVVKNEVKALDLLLNI